MHHKDGILEGSEGIFTTGVSEYSDCLPGVKEPLPRIYVKVQVGGTQTYHLALLDSGGHFFILSKEIADLVKDRLTESLGEVSLLTARGRIRGQLYQHQIELIADDGEDLVIEATVLVSDDWNGPSILGYTGAVDRTNLAIDPANSQIYFGPI